MTTLKEQILDILARTPGLTDREIANILRGASAPQQPVNSACREMAARDVLKRRSRSDGLVGNFLAGASPKIVAGPAAANPAPVNSNRSDGTDMLGEDEVKELVVDWLERDGWRTTVAWGRQHGIDIEAAKDGQRWIIEAKGCGSRNAMRVNYFLAILGETLQRMDDPEARHTIALPDMPQYRRLWDRLPSLAKKRTGVTALFVTRAGKIDHLFS